ncbi:MAG: CRISPR-associated endonuclease Cas1 [Polaromonas sp.]|jgi:CRISPR-associated protein Cas1|nr:CRISPR-associated endonuclease Cas1 [Polaromonas sp.]
MCASSRTPRKSLLLDIPIAGRCAWIALRRCDLGGHKYGVTIGHYEAEAADEEVALEPGFTAELPVGSFAALLLEPGTRISHEAVKRCAEASTRLIWVGEECTRLYGAGSTKENPERLLRQMQAATEPALRIEAVRRLSRLMFDEDPPPSYSIEKLRGIEGAKVRAWHARTSSTLGLEWSGRRTPDDVDQVLNWANACLYACAEIAISVLGLSPSLGVVHSGDARSFVFDLSDAVKFRFVLGDVLAWHARTGHASFAETRRFCRDHFQAIGLLDKLIVAAVEILANLLQVGPSTFVGRLDARRLKDLHAWLQHRGDEATLIVESKKAPLGFRMHTYGSASKRWRVVEIDGVQLIGHSIEYKSTG